MKIYRAAIFDMDGTLTDTLDDLHISVNEMLAHFGYPTRTLDEVRRFVGNGARKLMIRALPADKNSDAEVDAALTVYNECYARHCTDKVKPYAGIMNLLAALTDKKIPLGICTNKQHFAAVEIAEKILAPVKFAQVSGDEPGQPRKPDPTRPLAVMKSCGVVPEDVAYFGDTAVDMETARNANFLAVGVTWGFRPRSELESSGAQIIVDSPAEILSRINFG